MMRTIKKRMSAWKLAALIPITAAFFIFVACQDQLASDVAKSSTVALDVPQEVQDQFDALQKASPDTKYVIVELDEQGRAKAESMKDLVEKINNVPDQPKSITMITPTVKPGNPVRTFMIVDYNEATAKIGAQSMMNGDVYTVVEESAEYPGGFPALATFIASNLTYPNEARTNGLEGTVFVEFVINTDGSIADVKTKKGVDPVLDAEAERVVHALPTWKAGRQNGKGVRQQFVLPIKFNLNAGEKVGAITEQQQTVNVATAVSRANGKTVITGTVSDAQGNPLPGSNVLVSGTTTGIAADANGYFRLVIDQPSGELTVSFVGFEHKKISF